MSAELKKRNYSILGPESKLARERGLVEAEWYRSPLPRQRIKELTKRKDWPGIRDTVIWFALLAGVGMLAFYSWGTWWAVPAFAVYGVLYATVADSRWHECGHGTAFKTPWMNDAMFQLVSFMGFRMGTPWKWSHYRHHFDTVIVGSDPEIGSPRPPVWRVLVMEAFKLYSVPRDFKRMVLHFFGRMDKEEIYVPAEVHRQVFREARLWVLIYSCIAAWAIYIGSILPLMFIFLPTFYGAFIIVPFFITQHLGLHEDVLDHRLNTRTIYMNRVQRFLYWNMNYHTEHHMFPNVPYHALPALHEELKFDLPAAYPSLRAALKEVIGALRKQRHDPGFTVDRPLPDTAQPYRQ